jgi:hypothetical protein
MPTHRALALLATACACASAQSTGGWTWGAENDFNSRYLWRGIPYSAGPVMQPYAFVSRAGLTVSCWSNFVLNNEPQRGTFNQAFLTAEYKWERGRWRVEPALQGWYYVGPDGQASSTMETALRLSAGAGPVRLTTSQLLDVLDYRGSYLGDAGILWERRLGRGATVSSGVSVVWASGLFNATYAGAARRGGWNSLAWESAVTLPLEHGWYLRPHVEYNRIVSGPLGVALGGRNFVNFGLAAGFER